ncbi:hypothetical protein NGRA_2382 [Nosema granulosis]|uniref:Uncharacterized protein n=1 Tax=Nosema granulosis TaxID=83296 RepID=A0A9P6KXS0_9MICR|nr:hypothetical protein NGRA_2382 [Nosema granulosis]
MAVPLDLRKRKISFFDLEKKVVIGLDRLEDVIESKIKYVKDVLDHVEVLRSFPRYFVKNPNDKKEVFCSTLEDKTSLETFLGVFGGVLAVEMLSTGWFKIIFSDIISSDLCQFCSSDKFIFFGSGVSTEINEIFRRRKLLNIQNSKFNTDVPINYNKILIGPLDVTREELYDVLNDIGEVVSLRETMSVHYFTFSFYDPDLCKSFVDVLSNNESTNKEGDIPSVRFCYQDCIILKLKGVTEGIPLACSFKNTKIVFLLNVDAAVDINSVLSQKCRGVSILSVVFYNSSDKFKGFCYGKSPSKIFIECENQASADIIYHNLGGLEIGGRTIISGFYPEYNFHIGEYE